MDRKEFWKLLELVDHEALDASDEDAALEPLIDKLAGYDQAEIIAFEEQLAQVLYALDGRTHADNAGASGDSSDGFLYARSYVVARGQTHYQHVLANPSAMPRSLDEWCESLLFVAAQAWARRTGRDAEEWASFASVSYETGSNKARW